MAIKYSIKQILIVIMVLAVLAIMPNVASAIPELQIYIEGSTYDTSTETWVISSSGDFKLWVLGDVGAKGSIYDVYLTAAYLGSETGTITITPTTATGVADPSIPLNPTVFLTGIGTIPLTGDGSQLPTHDEYGPGINWTQFEIGDFTLTDSNIGDYITSIPSSFPDKGQINAYDIAITGYSSVHFDAFDHYVTKNGSAKYVFAPFSHDGESHKVPEPSSLWLMGLGLMGLGFFGRKKR